MTLPEITDRETWVQARRGLLVEEKAMTQARDALSSKRRLLPMVRIEKPYRFDGPEGPATLLDLFEGRDQLIVQHFMFDPTWDDGCPSCTAAADELSEGLLRHLQARGTTLALVSRAPLDKIERYRHRRGWDLPWYSSNGSEFNYDFHVTLDASVAPLEYNFMPAEELRARSLDWMFDGSSEQPGHSAFLTVDGEIFHTYSSYARGGEWLGGSYAFLDLTALGRQEDWEEPKGRSASVHRAEPNFAD
jgi:predicted dithiol-disulfide oxidoreductase (DUF899 family)